MLRVAGRAPFWRARGCSNRSVLDNAQRAGSGTSADNRRENEATVRRAPTPTRRPVAIAGDGLANETRAGIDHLTPLRFVEHAPV